MAVNAEILENRPKEIDSKEAKGGDSSSFIEPLFPVSEEAITALITHTPGDPEYPLDLSFEKDYEVAGDSDENLSKKHSIAVAIINDGRYRNLRFLSTKFIPVSAAEISTNAEELRADLKLRVREALLKRGDPKETIEAAEDLRNFAKTAQEGNTLDGQNFRKLVGIFGASRVVDILYRTRPEFNGIPVDQVKSILADYLGDFLVTSRNFNPDDIETGISYLSEANFQEGLLEVLKDSCLNFYNYSKKSNPNQEDGHIFQEYFEIISLELERIDSDDLSEVVGKAKDYYSALLDLEKPARIVDVLKEGREFPDVNQAINIREIADKKRVLIADEMRLGKSASVILAKETLDVKRALIVAPSNVVSTWKDYLSDRTDENGNQIGYFKKGEAPKTLVVEDIDSLQSEDLDSYEYIVISQERLNDKYTPLLEQIGYDMLVVDEIHKLKNLQDGIWASNLIKLAEHTEKEGSYLALLSGTPVPNKIGDVAMILKLLYPEQFANVENKVLIRSVLRGDLVDLRSLLIPRMQMKALRESLRVRDVTEQTNFLDLSDYEREIYEVLMEEDEIDAKDKMRVLRQFVINPDLLEITPSVSGSKINEVGEHIRKQLETKNKIVVFVNGYIENVIRGEHNIISSFNIPEGVEIRYIMGGINQEERASIQRDLNTSDKKMVVFISGQTADVGVDFSGGDSVIFYNEPWTKYDKLQQTARLLGDRSYEPLTSTTFIANDTIEEGINLYLEAKYKAIQKLLRGIPISDLEQVMLEKSADADEPDLEINPELAEYYFSTWDKMLKIFGYVKEKGEEEFNKFIARYGKEYANCYIDLGSRSYQANVARVSGTVIDEMVKKDGTDPSALKILDIASGPEMLRRHIAPEYQDQVISLDINEHHFQGEGGERTIGSFLKLPIGNDSLDFVNLSLALHYAKFLPSRGEFERLAVFAEMNRVLKVGGKAVINLMYSLDIKDMEKFNEVISILGFKMVQEYSGEVAVEQRYKSRLITLEKEREIKEWNSPEGDLEDSLGKIAEAIGKDRFDGLKFREQKERIKDSKRIIKEFYVNGTKFPVNFNPEDQLVLKEEEEILREGTRLKNEFNSIAEIPAEEIIKNGFVRFCVSRRANSHSTRNYVLFKRLRSGNGAVVIK